MRRNLRRSGGAGFRALFNRQGGNFPLVPAELRQLMAGYLLETEPEIVVERPEEVVALMSPHIDHGRGAPVYATCARVLAQLPKPDVIVLMGTLHDEESPWLFQVDNRNMFTPLGTIPCAIGAVDRLRQLFNGFPQFGITHAAHNEEWSLEATYPILQHRFNGESMPPVLPITVGWMKSYLQQNRLPAEASYIQRFILALGQLLAEMREEGMRVLIWNAVDFSHVGTWHGDRHWQLDRAEPRVIRKDKEVLEVLNTGDEQALFELFAADNNKFRSDVFEPLYVMLGALRAAFGTMPVGTTLDYGITGRVNRWRGMDFDTTVGFGATYWRQ